MSSSQTAGLLETLEYEVQSLSRDDAFAACEQAGSIGARYNAPCRNAAY